MTATQFLAAMDQKECTEAFSCQSSYPTTSGVTFADEWGASEPACESESAMYEMPSQVEAEISAGKIMFDGNAAAACVAGVAFSSCSDFWTNGGTFPAACDSVMVGTIADGGACVFDYDCATATSICDPTAHTCGPDTSQTGSARIAPTEHRLPMLVRATTAI
jgi:hypothetical protein